MCLPETLRISHRVIPERIPLRHAPCAQREPWAGDIPAAAHPGAVRHPPAPAAPGAYPANLVTYGAAIHRRGKVLCFRIRRGTAQNALHRNHPARFVAGRGVRSDPDAAQFAYATGSGGRAGFASGSMLYLIHAAE